MAIDFSIFLKINCFCAYIILNYKRFLNISSYKY